MTTLDADALRVTCTCASPPELRELQGGRLACDRCGAPVHYRRRVEARIVPLSTSARPSFGSCALCGGSLSGGICTTCGEAPGRGATA
jgi:hypothetical protein